MAGIVQKDHIEERCIKLPNRLRQYDLEMSRNKEIEMFRRDIHPQANQ